MHDERYDRRSRRRTMAAVLGSTAAITVGCSLLVAPAANASGLTGLVSSVTTPVTTAVGTTTSAVASTVNSTTSTVASTVGGTTTALGSTVTGVTTPVANAVDGSGSLASTLASTTNAVTGTVAGTTGAVASTVSAVTTPTATAVTGTTGAVTGTVAAVTDPLVSGTVGTVAGALDGATGSTVGTTTTSAVGSVLSGATSGLTSTTTSVVGAVTGTSGTTLVDTSGAGTGLINTGSTSGVLGLAAGSGGLSVGLLDGTATVTVGQGSSGIPTPSVTVAPTPTPTTTTTAPTTPASPAPAPAPTATAAPASTTIGSSTGTVSEGAASGPLATLRISRSAATVYPAKDGYLDSVRFTMTGLTATGQRVGLAGTAVLKLGSRTVKTWTVSGSTPSVSWNGRVGSKVKPGTYTLTVSARSATGATRTAKTSVKVLASHLVTRTATAAASTTRITLPNAVKKALQYGSVTVKLRTTAKVHGSAKLVIGTKRVTLRSGTRTTAAVPVAKGTTSLRIGHSWKAGSKLTKVTAIWKYRVLVK